MSHRKENPSYSRTINSLASFLLALSDTRVQRSGSLSGSGEGPEVKERVVLRLKLFSVVLHYLPALVVFYDIITHCRAIVKSMNLDADGIPTIDVTRSKDCDGVDPDLSVPQVVTDTAVVQECQGNPWRGWDIPYIGVSELFESDKLKHDTYADYPFVTRLPLWGISLKNNRAINRLRTNTSKDALSSLYTRAPGYWAIGDIFRSKIGEIEAVDLLTSRVRVSILSEDTTVGRKFRGFLKELEGGLQAKTEKNGRKKVRRMLLATEDLDDEFADLFAGLVDIALTIDPWRVVQEAHNREIEVEVVYVHIDQGDKLSSVYGFSNTDTEVERKVHAGFVAALGSAIDTIAAETYRLDRQTWDSEYSKIFCWWARHISRFKEPQPALELPITSATCPRQGRPPSSGCSARKLPLENEAINTEQEQIAGSDHPGACVTEYLGLQVLRDSRIYRVSLDDPSARSAALQEFENTLEQWESQTFRPGLEQDILKATIDDLCGMAPVTYYRKRGDKDAIISVCNGRRSLHNEINMLLLGDLSVHKGRQLKDTHWEIWDQHLESARKFREFVYISNDYCERFNLKYDLCSRFLQEVDKYVLEAGNINRNVERLIELRTDLKLDKLAAALSKAVGASAEIPCSYELFDDSNTGGHGGYARDDNQCRDGFKSVSDVLGVGFGAKKARGLLPPGFLIAFVDNANAEAMTVTRMFFKALVRTGRLKLFVGLDYSYESAEVNKVGWEQFMNTCRFLGLCRAGCWRRAGETFELVALSDRSIENEFHRILTKADTEWTATQKAFTLLFEIEWLVRKVDLKRKRRA